MIRISYRWLQELVDLPETPEQLRDVLTQLGFEVEELLTIPGVPDGVYAAFVLAIQPHPNADKLRLVTVALDGETKTVVCGAPNVEVGQWVPLAVVGTKIGDITLESRPIRGVVSEGMICSERELGRSDDHSGIWVLGVGDTDEWEAGEQLSERILSDAVFGIEVTLNRSDCLSHLGIARELSAKFGREIHLPPTPIDELDEPATNQVKVVIDAPDGCPRYRTRIMRKVDAKIASPFWMRERLKRMGTRSISAVVDATNYVMFETGHPLHAFDRAFLSGSEIGVRMATEGEKFVTLDGEERILTPEDVLIRDAEKAVALGGVMGGLNSEIRDTTTDVLLEAAYFHPVTIRRTARRLGLSTESSKRFERGADPDGVIYAMDRVCSLIQMLAGGEVYFGVVDDYPKQLVRSAVSLRETRLHSILGYDTIKLGEAEAILNRLGMATNQRSDISVEVTPPSWRHDILREIDLIEEVGRVYGFSEIPTKPSAEVQLNSAQNPEWLARQRWSGTLRSMGFSEAVSNSMVNPDDLAVLGILDGAVRIANPIAPELSVMRTNLLVSLLTAAAHNLRHGRERVALFEIGRVFGKGLIDTQSTERWHLAIAMAGEAEPQWWRASKPRLMDSTDVIGVLERLKKTELHSLTWSPIDYFGPIEEAYRLEVGGKPVGFAGRISGATRKESLRPEAHVVAKRFELDKPVWVLEFNAEALTIEQPQVKYQPFSRFPAVVRDLSYLAPDSFLAGQLLDSANKAIDKQPFDVTVSLFDRHEDKATKTIAFGVRLRMLAADRTLSEPEINGALNTVMEAIAHLPEVKLRSGQ
ncbi:MAG: phenylalanine--tRNA ligase subunit beta [bacterium]|nr:phenylalanine--tRNA ligase subunit beta [bacterium]